jgi:hypothetical protein
MFCSPNYLGRCFRWGTKITDICLSIFFNSIRRGKKEKEQKKEEKEEMNVKGRKPRKGNNREKKI